MNAMKAVGILLVIAGIAAVTFGGFSYTKETHKADIGPLHVAVQEKEDVNIPLWAGIGAIVVGVVLIALPRK